MRTLGHSLSPGDTLTPALDTRYYTVDSRDQEQWTAIVVLECQWAEKHGHEISGLTR